MTCGLGVVACSVYTEDLLEGVAGGAAAGGSGGCLAPSDCPGSDATCRYRVCLSGSCGTQNADAGIPCTDNGGNFCDGDGNCVECLNEQDCEPGQSCSAQHTCQDGKAENGAPCTSADACQSALCIDDFCCSVACDGFCQSCAVSGNEGSCSNIPEGTDPDDECSGGDLCNGVGLCRCNDGQTNGLETDQDCGGADCPGCANGQACQDAGDCVSNYCDGTCQTAPTCGDGSPNTGEDCDDNNNDSFDGCSAECFDPTTHLLISEVAVVPTLGEFVEIYNPTLQTVDLSDVYLADRNDYYLVTQGSVSTGASDFVARFPPGATVASQSFVVVSVETATDFNSTYGTLPDFDFEASDLGAPAMLGDIGGTAGLTNSGEMLMLFGWSGVGDLVTDIDYVIWGNTTNGSDKTGVTVGTSPYLNDTPLSSQSFIATEETTGESLHRCDTAEATETQSGGNGSSGHDETSENCAVAWKRDAIASPGAAPPTGFCP